MPKPILPLNYRAGIWAQVCLAPKCYLTHQKESYGGRTSEAHRYPVTEPKGTKTSCGFPQTPTHPRHRALQYRILLKLDVYATSYEGSFILSVIQWSTSINILKCGPQAETMMIQQQQQICFSENFLNKNLCTDPEKSFIVVKNLPANVGDPEDAGLIPGPGRSPVGGNDKLLQYSCLGNPVERRAWWATVHGVAESQTRLSDWTRMPSVRQSPSKVGKNDHWHFINSGPVWRKGQRWILVLPLMTKTLGGFTYLSGWPHLSNEAFGFWSYLPFK